MHTIYTSPNLAVSDYIKWSSFNGLFRVDQDQYGNTRPQKYHFIISQYTRKKNQFMWK